MTAPAPHFFDLDAETLTAHLARMGMPRYRTGQLQRWVYQRGVADPARMTDFPKADRRRLAEGLTFLRWRLAEPQHASDGTRKLLLESAAEAPTRCQTECVMIPAASRDSGAERRTACISSQVGCPVGCRFCASGLGGLELNLTAGQILEQVWRLNHHCLQAPDAPARFASITNVVFMGMGEPLANYNAVVRAIAAIAADWGFGLSARRITVSTVGLPAQIRRLADQLDLPVTLALSLHAPNDDLRRELIPWAERVTIDHLIDACRYYFDRTGREITLEYILLGGVNDRPGHAKQLARLAGRLRCNVNLIRYNEVASLPYHRPAGEDVHDFQRVLRGAGVNCHIRASRGRDIAAACGQLRHEARQVMNCR